MSPQYFASFEEDSLSLKRNMLRFGMDLESLERDGKIKVMDLEILEGQGMGSNMEVPLSALDKIQGKRLVVDSLTAFEPARRTSSITDSLCTYSTRL